MGQRYEKNRKSVGENKEKRENLRSNRDTLKREYAPMSLLEGLEHLLDDEASDSIRRVRAVGEQESARLDSETDAAEAEKRSIADEIRGEIAKLDRGAEKLRRTGKIEFGKSAVEQARAEYQKQIDQFKKLMEELGVQAPEHSGSASGGSEGIGEAASEQGEELPKPLHENETVFIPHGSQGPLTTVSGLTGGSASYQSIVSSLQNANVEYRPIRPSEETRTTDRIVEQLSGGDLTEGSCSSLALAFAGNRAGYEVTDFRGGNSRAFFSSRDTIQQICDLPGVQSSVLNGTDDIVSVNQLLTTMVPGREYYLAAGQHASIVRNIGGSYQYLELQHPSNGNGWHELNNDILTARFGCSRSHESVFSNYLISVDSLADSSEFLGMLGFIHTAGNEQRKGGAGHVR